MNIVQAREQALNNTRSWKELADLIYSANKGGMCKNGNRSTRQEMATSMLWFVEKEEASEVPAGSRFSEKMDQHVMTVNGLLIMNLLREFA